MRTPKPVIHSRDHEHGGADVVRIAWEGDPTPPPVFAMDITATPSPSSGVGPTFGFTVTSDSPYVTVDEGNSSNLPRVYCHPPPVLHATLTIATLDGGGALSLNAFAGNPAPFTPGGASLSYLTAGTYVFDVDPAGAELTFRMTFTSVPLHAAGSLAATLELTP